jgi:hypothetical protein
MSAMDCLAFLSKKGLFSPLWRHKAQESSGNQKVNRMKIIKRKTSKRTIHKHFV